MCTSLFQTATNSAFPNDHAPPARFFRQATRHAPSLVSSAKAAYYQHRMSIQVGIRCRPFTIDDQLGVDMKQNSAQDVRARACTPPA